jgi:hypothetical protein
METFDREETTPANFFVLSGSSGLSVLIYPRLSWLAGLPARSNQRERAPPGSTERAKPSDLTHITLKRLSNMMTEIGTPNNQSRRLLMTSSRLIVLFEPPQLGRSRAGS